MKKEMNRKYGLKTVVGLFFLLLTTFVAVVVANFFIKSRQTNKPKAQSVTIDFYGQPINLLKVFGQHSFKETSEDTVTANKIFHAAGVLVDTSVKPNIIYIADTGNNRILGFKSLGTCSNLPSQKCTNDTDCNSGICSIDIHKGADIIFGQSNDSSASCNGDSNLGVNFTTSAEKLCLTGLPQITNTGEFWMRMNFDVDNEGNLYIPDTWNNRILKFNQPFSQDKTNGKGDTLPDFVIGQDDFTGNTPNHGYGPFTKDNQSIYISAGGLDHVSSRGVSVDPNGNVWIADTFNFRVLRFPPGSKTADLVIGQGNFTNADSSSCSEEIKSAALNKLCTPTLARIDPESGKLYVSDEHPGGFPSRILVFEPPFTNGMAATKSIFPLQDGPFQNSSWNYSFQTTGFVFNKYKQGEYANGKLWVNEHDARRVILLDDDGNILKVIGTTDKYSVGCDFGLYNRCKGFNSIESNFNLCWPGGNIGMDNANNIYLADERYSRISRFALPYNVENNCVPDSNGGLFDGIRSNSVSGSKFRGSVGTLVFNNQLIVRDKNRYLVWENYLQKEAGSRADFVVGQDSDNIRVGNFIGERAHHTIDDHNRLWTYDNFGKIMIYQLPFRANQQPLAHSTKLYWIDDPEQEVDYNSFERGIAFDSINKSIWVIDRKNHRLLRISNYNDFNNKLYVDAVLGQPDKQHIKCNNNQEEGWVATGPPTAESLCQPSFAEFDKQGNLYVIENTYECHGNGRIVVFMADDLSKITTLFPNTAARKVFIADSLTEMVSCRVRLNEPHSPVSIAFNSRNQMIIGNDGYYININERQVRQLWFYNDPLKKDARGNYLQGQKPDAAIKLPLGAAGEINFDNEDNLIVQDHTWAKVWVINLDKDPSWLVYNGSPLPTATNTPKPTATPSSSTASPIPTSVTPQNCIASGGRTDVNRPISILDFEVWRSNFGSTGTNPADFNCDNSVNILDYEIWRNAFINSNRPSPTPRP